MLVAARSTGELPGTSAPAPALTRPQFATQDSSPQVNVDAEEDHLSPDSAGRCIRAGACGRCGCGELCGPGGLVPDLLDCAEDHRRGALDGPAHEVPGAVAVMDLGEPPVDRHELAAGLVVMSQKVSALPRTSGGARTRGPGLRRVRVPRLR